MRFSAIHKTVSYLMVAAAFAALALSRELSNGLVAATLAGALASWWAEPQRSSLFRARAWTTVWNVATLAIFSFTILDALRGEALYAGVRFLCFLLVNKLWNRRASRDYLQAYVVSFLMLVAGAALSTDLAYAACFLAYTVFATWTLTLFHLRREMEENYLLKHSDGAQSERVEVERILNSRRIVGTPFLVGTGLVSLAVFVCATLTFFLIPRFGFGFFMSRQRRAQTTVGFSDRVDLGEYGLIKDNPQVVMRVELPSPPSQPLRMRGVSFDRYVHGHWSRTSQIPPEPLRNWRGLWLVNTDPRTRLSPEKVAKLTEGTTVQQVYLDPLDTAVLFGAPQPIAFELPQKVDVRTGAPVLELEGRGAGEVLAVERHVEASSGRAYSIERKSGIKYTVLSRDEQPPLGKLLSLPDAPPPDDPALEPYLALPPDLPPRIVELARKVAAGHKGPFAKAVAIEGYLQRTYKYTLDLKRDERYEPLEDFLFVEKAGHCEYFASAMAVMLRAVGVPTRSVNGFLGGEWNAYGKYVAIRQGDAHAWVEAFIDGRWMTFDPTPPAPFAAARNGVWNAMRQLLDNAELAWFKWVIEYDLGKQVDALSSLRRFAEGRSSRGSGDWLGALKQRRTPILLVILGAGGLWLIFRRRARGTSSAPRRAQVAHHAFQRALKALEKRGLARAASETGRELAARVIAAGDPGAEAFQRLVELYYAARFGGEGIDEAELSALADRVVRPPVTRELRHAA